MPPKKRSSPEKVAFNIINDFYNEIIAEQNVPSGMPEDNHVMVTAIHDIYQDMIRKYCDRNNPQRGEFKDV